MLMRLYSKEIKNKKFQFMRIDKKKAKAAYRAGLTVLWCPVNIAPFTGWGLEVPININNQNCDGIEFDKLYDEYCFYNCNKECGYYPAYYIPVIDYCDFASGDTYKHYDYSYMEV